MKLVHFIISGRFYVLWFAGAYEARVALRQYVCSVDYRRSLAGLLLRWGNHVQAG